MAFWVGAVHWSKPWPVKLPGVTRFAAPAGDATTRVAARVATVARTASTGPAVNRVVRRREDRDVARMVTAPAHPGRVRVTLVTEPSKVTRFRRIVAVRHARRPGRCGLG